MSLTVRFLSEEELGEILALAGVSRDEEPPGPAGRRWTVASFLLALIAGKYISQKSTEAEGHAKPRKKAAQRLLKAVRRALRDSLDGPGAESMRQEIIRDLGTADLLDVVGWILLEQVHGEWARGAPSKAAETEADEIVAFVFGKQPPNPWVAAIQKGLDPGIELVAGASLPSLGQALESIVERDRVPRVRKNGALKITVIRLAVLWEMLGNSEPTGSRHSQDNRATPTAFTRFAMTFFEAMDGPPASSMEAAVRLERITNAVENWTPGAEARRRGRKKR